MQKDFLEHGLNSNRRRFLSRLSLGLGSAALGSLLVPDLFSGVSSDSGLAPGIPHFAPKANNLRVATEAIHRQPLMSITPVTPRFTAMAVYEM